MKIMVVDDSPTFRAAVARMLTQMGHEPMPAENGREALERVKEHFRRGEGGRSVGAGAAK